MLTVLLLTVFVDLIMAVGVGIVLACLLLTVRVTKQVQSSVDDFELTLTDQTESLRLTDDRCFQVRVVNIDGPFFFGSTSRLVGQFGDMLGTRTVIFNCDKVPFIDLSAFFALSEIIVKLKEQGITPLIVANSEIKEKLLRLDIGSILDKNQIHHSFDCAVAQARADVYSKRQ